MSYALGMNMCEYLAHLPIKIDTNTFVKAFQDFDNDKKFELSGEEYSKFMKMFQEEAKKASEKAIAEIAARNVEIEKEFLAENGKKEGVKTTASGLQYEVITEGNGDKPAKTDVVKVHYTGMLLNGQVFDSSVQRGEPAQFGLNQVIAGWTEGLQLMTCGSKYKFYIPAKLAYGERGAGEMIPPSATLIFEVELLDIVK
ncbi:MAG: FKBP-type peptidyl-prolyl cis-trans isomerase [Lentisphaeria bacterium]|nr:FKBP-type peptidyl-prolyl cis-trans isomerase [Lentisphaeria bacterium]